MTKLYAFEKVSNYLFFKYTLPYFAAPYHSVRWTPNVSEVSPQTPSKWGLSPAHPWWEERRFSQTQPRSGGSFSASTRSELRNPLAVKEDSQE